ncbi:MAG TPA: hypothetical protein ENK64_01690 [Flavobacteriales bacterium]|nr:hypothetical protein [Flavobacteriales bacterium]
MKKSILYLLVFLLVVSSYFAYNSYKLIQTNKALKQELQETNEGYDQNIQYAIQLEDSISGLKKQIDSLLQSDRFSLQGNHKAQAYLNEAFDDEQNWSDYIKRALLQTNDLQKGDNPLIPYAGMEGPMRFDAIKILNHKWLIAHFTDGAYQGEVLIRYDIDKNGKLHFKVLDQTLYK